MPCWKTGLKKHQMSHRRQEVSLESPRLWKTGIKAIKYPQPQEVSLESSRLGKTGKTSDKCPPDPRKCPWSSPDWGRIEKKNQLKLAFDSVVVQHMPYLNVY